MGVGRIDSLVARTGSRVRVRAVVAIAAAASVGLLVAIPGESRAASKAIWGPVSLPGGGSAFPVYRDLGVDTLQIGVDFSSVAPTRPADVGDPSDPAYRWPGVIDESIREGAPRGIDVALLVTRSPGWANGGGREIDAPDPAAFAAFMGAASRRYPAVRKWMIWGEPNRDDRFLPNGDDSPAAPRAYAKILDAAYGSLKAVSKTDTVIGGMTWTGGTVKPARFLELMRLPNGLPPRLDWFGHNPFPFRFPDLSRDAVPGGFRDISDLDVFGRQLRRTYVRRCAALGRRRCASPRFWLSEFTIQSDHASRTFVNFVSKENQARWLTASYAIADRLESVAGLGWLSLFDGGDSSNSENWGLLTSRGGRKPAYAAYRAAPSERLAPRVRVPARIRRAVLEATGLGIGVRPRTTGRVRFEFRGASGRVLSRASRDGRAGRLLRVRLFRGRERRTRYLVTVKAPRGARVTRQFAVR